MIAKDLSNILGDPLKNYISGDRDDLIREYIESKMKNPFKSFFYGKMLSKPEFIRFYYYAVSTNSMRIVKYLVENNFVNINDKLDGETSVLNQASKYPLMCDYLLSRNLDVNQGLHHHVFLSKIINNDTNFFKAYINRCNEDILSHRFDGETLVEVLGRIDNPVMSEHLSTWIQHRLNEKNQKDVKRKEILDAAFNTMISLMTTVVYQDDSGASPHTLPSPKAYEIIKSPDEKMSLCETRVLNVVKTMYPDEEIISNYRPDFLYNPYTGCNLEIDIWIPNKNIAIEVDGIQHYEYTPYYHANIDDFIQQRMRDVSKDVRLKHLGIKLIRIPSIFLQKNNNAALKKLILSS